MSIMCRRMACAFMCIVRRNCVMNSVLALAFNLQFHVHSAWPWSIWGGCLVIACADLCMNLDNEFRYSFMATLEQIFMQASEFLPCWSRMYRTIRCQTQYNVITQKWWHAKFMKRSRRCPTQGTPHAKCWKTLVAAAFFKIILGNVKLRTIKK